MGHEFIAKIDPREVSLSDLAGRLGAEGSTVVESGREDSLLLRWKGPAREGYCPEDIMITVEDGEMMVLIHQGSGVQRKLFLEKLGAILGDLSGTSSSFREA